jgi:hypothetical protein
MDQNQNGIKDEKPADQFTVQFVVGNNDVSDFIRDTYNDLLDPNTDGDGNPKTAPRDPTTAELLSTNARAVESARFAALPVILKELLATYNSDPLLNGTVGEARQVLVERLFRINGPVTNEIGNLSPTFFNALTATQQADLVNAFARQLKAGTTSPERIIIAILSDPQYQYRGAITNNAYVDKVYNDLLGRPGTTAEHTKYDATVGTPTGAKAFVSAVVNGAVFRDRLTGFLYQNYLGRLPTTAEKTGARSLMALAPVANGLQGSERVVSKILGSREFFFAVPAQSDVPSADNGLHTNRSWIEGVFRARLQQTTGETFGQPVTPAVVGKVSTPAQRDLFSQKILDRFKTQRTTFVRGLVNGKEFRTLQLKKLYTQVFGLTLTDLPTITRGLNALAVGATFQSITAGWLGSQQFYDLAPDLAGEPATSKDTWSKAVILRMLGRPATPAEVTALSAKAGTTATTRTAAAAMVLTGKLATFPNGNEYRDLQITAAFNLVLHRTPQPAERTAYENFLKISRWESMYVDIMASGAADLDPVTAGVQNSLPREFWEIAD